MDLITGQGITVFSNDQTLLKQVNQILDCFKIQIELPPLGSSGFLLDEVTEIQKDIEEDMEASIAKLFDEDLSTTGDKTHNNINVQELDSFVGKEMLGELRNIQARMNTSSLINKASEMTQTTPKANLVTCGKDLSKKGSLDQRMMQNQKMDVAESSIKSSSKRANKRKHTVDEAKKVSKNFKSDSVEDNHADDQQEFQLQNERKAHDLTLDEDLEPALNQTNESNPSAIRKTEAKENEVQTLYECHICKCKMSQFNNLLSHIGGVHHRSELQKYLSKEKPRTCQICLKEFKNMETHILCKHKILDGIIPSKEELTVKPGNDPKRGLEELSEEVLANSANSKRFKCPMCPIEKTKSVALLKHLTMDHYKEELRSMYGARDEWMCGECNKSFQNEDQLINHLVTFHKALKNLMVLFDDKNNQTANSVTIAEGNNTFAQDSGVDTTGNESSLDISANESAVAGLNDSSVNESKDEASFAASSDNSALGASLNASAVDSSSGQGDEYLQCPNCSYQTKRFPNLQAHVACIHYREKLLSMSDGSKTCTLCKSDFKLRNWLLVHLMRVHDGLNGILPLTRAGFLQQQGNKCQENSEAEKDCNETIKCEESGSNDFDGNGDASNKADLGEETMCSAANNLTHYFQCPMCKNKTFAKYEKLLNHLAKKHLKTTLLRTFANSNTFCSLCCDAAFSGDQDKLVEHLAVHHLMLDGLVPSKDSMTVVLDGAEANSKTRFECLKCGRLIMGHGPMIKHIQGCLDKPASEQQCDEKDQVLFL